MMQNKADQVLVLWRGRWLLLLLLVSGCFHLTSEGEATNPPTPILAVPGMAVPPTATLAAPLVTEVISVTAEETAVSAAPSAAPPSAAPPSAAPPSAAPPSAAPIPIAQVDSASPLSPLPLGIRWRYDVPRGVTALDLFSLDGGPWPDILLGEGTTDGQVATLALDQTEYWRAFRPGAILALVGADLDADLIGDVIVGGADGTVTVLEGGLVRWSYQINGAVTAVQVWPIPLAGATVLFGSDNGQIGALDVDGTLLWSLTPDGTAVTHLLPADLNGDGQPDLVAATAAGRVVTVWSASTADTGGTIMWEADLGRPIQSLLAPDLNGDGATEVVAGLESAADSTVVVALSSTGAELWHWPIVAGDASAMPLTALAVTLATVGGNTTAAPVPVVLVGGERLTALAADGRALWQTTLGAADSGLITALAVGDLDADGQRDLVAGTDDGQVVLLDEQGRERGRFQGQTPVQELRIANIDIKTNIPEILLRGETAVYLLDLSGVFPSQDAAPLPTPAPTRTLTPLSTPTALLDETLPHYQLQVDLDFDGHTAAVSQTVTLSNDTADVWHEVVFHAAPAYWNPMFILNGVWVTLEGDELPVSPEQELTMIHLPLPRLVNPGESLAVRFDFELALARLDPVGWGPEGNAGWDDTLMQMGDWYPVLVPYQDGDWFTWQYWPVGDPVVSRLANYDVAVTVAPGVMIAAPGYTGLAGSVWHYRLAQARAFSFLASRNYVVYEGRAGDVPVQVFVTQRYNSVGPVVLDTAVKSINLFSELYGPYPYPELVIAENGFLTAMEYSGIVSLSGYGFETYEGGNDSLLVTITAHEVAHQWWYGAVGNDQVNEPWVDESLAMMSELLYYEQYAPELVDWWWQYRVDGWDPAGPVNVTIYDYLNSEIYVHNMYGQGMHFLQDARLAMGVEAFQAFLQDYYGQYAFGFAQGEDLLARMQANTAVDLTPLITLYFR